MGDVFYILCNNVVESLECGSNALPLGKYSFPPLIKYWYAEFVYQDTTNSVVDYGAVGRVSGAVPEKIYVVDGINYLRLRFYVNDVYDLFLTVNSYSGALCNHTIISNTTTLMIPHVDIVQPKCLYANATLTPINNTLINLPFFQVDCLSYPDPTLSMAAYTPTFQYKVDINGVYRITYGNLQYLFNLEAQNPLIPIFSFSSAIIGQNSTMSIQNSQMFSSIQLVDYQGNLVTPTNINQFPIVNSMRYKLIAVSNTCGTQVMDVVANLYPYLKSKVLNYSCANSTVDVSFDFDFQVPGIGTQNNITIGDFAYQLGTPITLRQGSLISVGIKGQYNFDYLYPLPRLNPSIGYTIDSYPTCSTTGIFTIHYDGNITDVSVNYHKVTSNKVSFEFGRQYSVQTLCGQEIVVFYNNPPIYSIDSSTDDCLGIMSVVVRNYQSYSEIILIDSALGIDYTAIDGIFYNVYPSSQLSFSYKENSSCYSSGIRVPYTLAPQDSSQIQVKHQILQPSSSCSDKVLFNYQVINKGVILENVTDSFYYGQNITHNLGYGTCGDYINIPLVVDNLLNVTTYKIVKSAVCKYSLATIQLESVDIINLQSIYINGIQEALNSVDATYQIPTGQHTIELTYSNPNGNCETILNVDIPFTNNTELTHTITNQDSTKCDELTGSVRFANFNDFITLQIDGENSSIGAFNHLNPDIYTIKFNHSVCGVGQIVVPIITDGEVTFEEIYRPTCSVTVGPSDGIYRMNVRDRFGNQIKNSSISSPYAYQTMGIVTGQTYGEYIFEVQSGDFCIWNLNGEFKQQEIKYNDFCKLDTLAPANPPTPDFDFEIIRQCGTMDTILQIPQSVVDEYYVVTQNGNIDANNQINMYSSTFVVLTSKSNGTQYYYNIGNSNYEMPPPVQYSTKDESCSSSGDGSITITNTQTNYSYTLVDSQTLNSVQQPATSGVWTNLPASTYRLTVVNNTGPTCQSSIDIIVGSKAPVLSTSIVNICSAAVLNSVATFSTTVNNQAVNNVNYSVDGVQINSNKIELTPGNYTVKAFVNESTCRQFTSQTFTVQSNIVEAEVTSSICSTASIKATSELQDQLTIKLINVTNGGNSLVGQAINGNTANITNLSRGTYQFTVAESSVMNSKFIYLFVLYIFFNLINHNFVESLDCGSNALPLQQYNFPPITKYWYAEFIYEDIANALVDFGAVGRNTHAIPEKVITVEIPKYLHLRFYVNDIYDIFLTARDYNGELCNHTIISNTTTLMIPHVDIVQPKCLYSNATLTPINNSVINLPFFTVKGVSNTDPANSLIADTPSFEYRVNMNGVYSITYPPNIVYYFHLFAQNPLVPVIGFSPAIIGQNSYLSVQNTQMFSSIQLINIQGNLVTPTSPNQFPTTIGMPYQLIAVSDTCGTQVMSVTPGLTPSLKSTILGYNCSDSTVEMSFDFGYPVTGYIDMSIENIGPYQLGTPVKLAQGSYVRVSISGDFQNSYIFSVPSITQNQSYTVSTYPTCTTNGSFSVNYDGNISDIKVNSIPLTSHQVPFEFNQQYTIQGLCGAPISLLYNNRPLYSIDSTSYDCLGIMSVVVQNYQSYSEIILNDHMLNINYTTINGIFQNVYPSSQLSFIYTLDKSCQSYQYSIPYTMTIQDSSQIQIKQKILQSSSSCSEKVLFNYQVINNGVILGNFTDSFYYGQSIGHKYRYGTCNNIIIVAMVDNSLNVTSYKIIQPAVCKDSIATIQLESVDIMNLKTVFIDDIQSDVTSDGLLQVPTGQHTIELTYANPFGNCKTILNVDIPFTNNTELTHTITNQDSTKCHQSTGSVQFANFNGFISLQIDGENSTNGTFSNLPPDIYTIKFNHSVCGVGQFVVPIITDGEVTFEEIYRPTCSKPDGESDGVYRMNVRDRLRNQIQNSSINTPYVYQTMGILAGQSYGNYQFEVQSGDFCIWNLNGEFSKQEISVNYYNVTPYTSFPGSFYFNASTYIRIDDAFLSSITGIYVYPGYVDFALFSNFQATFTINYNDNCQIYVPAPLTPPTPDFGITTFRQCGSMDTILQVPQSVVNEYYVTTNNGNLDTNNQMYIFDSIYIILTSKSNGTQYFYNAQNTYTASALAIQYTSKDESCSGSGDGSITVTNPIPNVVYSLTDTGIAGQLPQPATNGIWKNLHVSKYLLTAVNTTDPTCQSSIDVYIRSNSPVLSTSIVNICSAAVLNSVATFSTTVNNQAVNNVYYSVDGVQINSNKIELTPGNYTVKAFVNESTCRQFTSQTFTVQSNIVEAEVTSSICSTASIKATSELQDQLTIRLINITNGGNSLVGQAINGNTANITNLSRGTYQFTITESSGCSITTTSFNILECPTQPPTETPTQTPVNHSYQLSPSTSLFLFSILSLFILLN
ncbi:hypothetical protein PPL_00052 [Heterostelium album PN500]|uniref:Uncharacterized protein n=1 Tax=Heterostelium pallidum (strain ATCC 26659 / Pp 5 / PN500) TaxID=670386 RepID=D3BVQ1_HETP5|nr:hypothetical protein PPL_00052 [Heterostelium album PN500]EFA74554.1 hypothetical protein PPL_00052 [Heterostelium album PN500]|eukprot:XP_020426688.1 hypothetical protein PPL_00052 [Heterostelium album PN500]